MGADTDGSDGGVELQGARRLARLPRAHGEVAAPACLAFLSRRCMHPELGSTEVLSYSLSDGLCVSRAGSLWLALVDASTCVAVSPAGARGSFRGSSSEWSLVRTYFAGHLNTLTLTS